MFSTVMTEKRRGSKQGGICYDLYVASGQPLFWMKTHPIVALLLWSAMKYLYLRHR